ncbi:MAG: adenylate/guanylate cyclase domain-containing protein [Candidatus Riflebacteria bacterium]|nr:adenylate/guanylate cyclase domain-containing protein [Candidatus Riflebacteria bacterium]
MGIVDYFSGKIDQELKNLKVENVRLNEKVRKIEGEYTRNRETAIKQANQNVALLVQFRELAGCTDQETAYEMAWGILTKCLELKKGAIFQKSGDVWKPIRHIGFTQISEIPETEDSVFTASVKSRVLLTKSLVREDPMFSALEGRGTISDISIASPFKIEGRMEGIVVVCRLAGKLFSEEDTLEMIRLLSSVLGLSLSNARVMEAQKDMIAKKTHEANYIKSIFSKMVSPKIVEALAHNSKGIVLGGKRENIVIFFSDIRGFTSLSEKMAPELTVEMLNKYFSTVSEIIIKYNGTLDKFIGDAVMALFNTPVEIDQPVRAAFHAAIEIQHELKKMSIEFNQKGIGNFSVGIGMNFQEAVVGYVGSERMASFTAIGDGVNIASRLCSVARGGEIVISEDFYKLIGITEGFEMRDGIELKGKGKPLRVYVYKK